MTIMMIIIRIMKKMMIMAIIIIIESIYDEILAKTNKIPEVEKTAKSNVLQPFERKVEKNLFRF